ncbi:MAG: HAD family hydrolase [Gemmatimonadetes bacterium]|nr:HAD family hydrolase [Gemmatimonadota bacterium]
MPDAPQPPRDWRAVLFDLDGTLADTVPLILRCYRHTMLQHRGRELPDELWVRTIGRPLRSAFGDFAVDADEVERMVATYVDFQRGVHDEMVCSFPEARSTMARLRVRGVRVGVVTSKGREMTLRTLGCCAIDAELDVLITADDVVKGKPDPEPVLKAMEGLGIERAEEVLFVGDSPHDLIAGRAAGVRTAAAVWGPFSRAELEASEPDYWLAGLPDVLSLRPIER